MTALRKAFVLLTALCVVTAGGLVGATGASMSDSTEEPNSDGNGDGDSLFSKPIDLSIAGITISFGPPQDLDGDGLYEDVTGDGNFDSFDAAAHAIVVTALNTGAVDFSDEQANGMDIDGNGEVTYDDARELFELAGGELPEIPNDGSDSDSSDSNAGSDDNSDANSGVGTNDGKNSDKSESGSSDSDNAGSDDSNSNNSDSNNAGDDDDSETTTYYFQVEREATGNDEPNEAYEFEVTSNNDVDIESVDEREPNDDADSATELMLGDRANGVVNDSDDDWYSIELEDGQQITVNGTDEASDTTITAYAPTNEDGSLEAFDSGNFTIVEETLIQFETPVSADDSDDSNADDGDSNDSDSGTDDGDNADGDSEDTQTYYVQAEQVDSLEEGSAGYYFDVTSNQGGNNAEDSRVDSDGNDSPSEADEIEPGERAGSSISNEDTEDWFVIELEDGQLITINGADETSAVGLTAYRLTDEDAENVTEDDLAAIGSDNLSITEETVIEFETANTSEAEV